MSVLTEIERKVERESEEREGGKSFMHARERMWCVAVFVVVVVVVVTGRQSRQIVVRVAVAEVVEAGANLVCSFTRA